MWFATDNEHRNESSITGAFGGNASATHVTHGFGISEKRSGACASTSRTKNIEAIIVGSYGLSKMVRHSLPRAIAACNPSFIKSTTEELLAMLLVALAVFLLSA